MNLDEGKQAFINTFLEGTHIARMATVDENHRPHVVPVWYGWDGEQLWISAYASTLKVRHLEKNKAISIIIDVTGGEGETRAVLMEGDAELVKAPREFLKEKFVWIYTRYLGADGVLAKSPQEWIADPENLLIKLKPTYVKTWHW